MLVSLKLVRDELPALDYLADYAIDDLPAGRNRARVEHRERSDGLVGGVCSDCRVNSRVLCAVSVHNHGTLGRHVALEVLEHALADEVDVLDGRSVPEDVELGDASSRGERGAADSRRVLVGRVVERER